MSGCHTVYIIYGRKGVVQCLFEQKVYYVYVLFLIKRVIINSNDDSVCVFVLKWHERLAKWNLKDVNSTARNQTDTRLVWGEHVCVLIIQ